MQNSLHRVNFINRCQNLPQQEIIPNSEYIPVNTRQITLMFTPAEVRWAKQILGNLTLFFRVTLWDLAAVTNKIRTETDTACLVLVDESHWDKIANKVDKELDIL